MKKRLLTLVMLIAILGTCALPTYAAKVNLARNSAVTAYLKGVGGNDLPASGYSAPQYASNAIDGDVTTAACAANEWAWSLWLDLGKSYAISEVSVTFGEDPFYASDYSIAISADGKVWNNVVEIRGDGKPGQNTHTFAPTAAKWVRVTDLKPNVNVSQMQICELEVYEGSSKSFGASMASPTDGKVGFVNTEPIKINVASNTSAAYLPGFKVIGADGIEVDSYKKIENGLVTITPKNKLAGGKYVVKVQGKEIGSFTAANDNLSKKAKVRLVNSLEVEIEREQNLSYTPTAVYAVDGDPVTAAVGTTNARKWYLEMDFGKPYENINSVDITISAGGTVGNVEILASNDGRTWDTVKEFTAGTKKQFDLEIPPVTARYMRFSIRNENDFAGGFAEVDVMSIPKSAAPKAEFVTNAKANGEIVVNFSDGIDMTTLKDGIFLKKGSQATPCADRIPVEIDFETVNASQVIVKPKTGLDYDEYYVINVNHNLKSIWGVEAEPSFKEFKCEPVKALEITTRSSSDYLTDRENSIYPAFVDNLKYQSWTFDGERDYYDIKADGGKGPYKFNIVSGSLPDGINMDENGRLSGTPTKEGTFEFTVKATDSAGNAVEKALVMEANPFRAKWYDDMRFGIFNQSGVANSYIANYGVKEGMKKYEEMVNRTFDPEKWAQQLEDLGAKAFNFTAFGGDGVRKWPSKFASTNGLAIKRNVVKELLDACHKRDIKLMTYIAPDTTWTGSIELDPETGTWYPLMKGAAMELAEMGVDSIWMDMGMNTIEADWYDTISAIRTINPYIVVVTNGGIANGGKFTNYPYNDIVNWEGPEAWDCPDSSRSYGDMPVVYKANVRKKVGLEAAVLAGPHWSSDDKGHGDVDYLIKPTDEIIKNIQDNWDVGATYMINYPFQWRNGGELINPLSKAAIDTITKWVKANITPSDTPVPSIEEGTYGGEQELTLTAKGKIYYTTDGSMPNDQSIEYTEPIKITDSVKIKAAAFEEGKGKSRIMEKDYVISGKTDSCEKLVTENLKISVEQPKISAMYGMEIRTGNNPLEIRAIGRYATGNDGKGHLITLRKNDGGTSQPLVYSEIDMSVGTADAQGFKYKEIAPVVLEPRSNYVILCEETPETTFGNVKDIKSVAANHATIFAGSLTDDQQYITGEFLACGDISDKQQIMNLKFNVLPCPDTVDMKNIAAEAVLKLLDNNGTERGPSAWRHYSYNAIDDNLDTYAAPGYAYAWTLFVDLKKEYKDIDEIIVTMSEQYYATEFQIDVSNDNVNWKTITYVNDNHTGGEKKFTYDPFTARYVRVRSLKPDGAGQEGSQMTVAELKIYQTDEAFANN